MGLDDSPIYILVRILIRQDIITCRIKYVQSLAVFMNITSWTYTAPNSVQDS